MGFKLLGPKEWYKYFKDNIFEIEYVPAPKEGDPNVFDLMRDSKIDLVFNTPTKSKSPGKLGFQIRRSAVEFKIPYITSIDTATPAIGAYLKMKKTATTCLLAH